MFNLVNFLNKAVVAVFTAAFLIAIFPSISKAQEKKQLHVDEAGFLLGFKQGKLQQKDDYQAAIFVADFDLSFGGSLSKGAPSYPKLVSFQLEPFAGVVYQPDLNVEFGNNFFLKFRLTPQSWKIRLYIKTGAGLIYLTQHTREQSTQFNFIESGAGGLQYRLDKKTSLLLEGRFTHTSNSGIKRPNRGINGFSVLGGASYNF